MSKKKKSVFVLFGCLLLFCLVEVTFRIGGEILLVSTRFHNRISSKDLSQIRILTIGESTTADFFAANGSVAWPRQLEALLRHQGLSVRVYNEGLSGTSSPFIVSKVGDFLTEYQPHIVISMMGTNDTPGISFVEGSKISGSSLIWSNLKTVKLFHWVADAVRSITSCRLDHVSPAGGSPMIRALALASKSPPERVAEFFQTEFNQGQIVSAMAEISKHLRGDFKRTEDTIHARSYAAWAFQQDPHNYDAAFQILQLDSAVGDLEGCRQVSKKLIQECGPNLDDAILTQISYCMNRESLEEFSVLLSSKRIKSGLSASTAYHYRLLHDKIRAFGAKHIVMQYPTLPVQNLRRMFEGPDFADRYDDIYFVSNEGNFKDTLRTSSYESVFRDRFRGTWGHTTALGHALIAKNLVPVVIEAAKNLGIKSR